MSSSKPRIQSYIESRLYEQFEQERVAWGLSQSQALERMLSERYSTDQNSHADNEFSNSLQKISKELAKLVERVTNLEAFNGNLVLNGLKPITSELPSKSIAEKGSLKEKWKKEVQDKYAWDDGYCRLRLQNGNVFVGLICSVSRDKTCKIFDSLTDTQLNVDIDRLILPSELELVTSELPSELESVTSELPSELEGNSLGNLPSELFIDGISQLLLAERLGCSDRYLRRLEKEGKLEQWSKQKDPERISWELRGKKYYPKSLRLRNGCQPLQNRL